MEPFLGEIRTFGFSFIPRGWHACDGTLLPIPQNTALFSLLGTTYGGDGRTNFAVPDLRGRSAINQGQGNGLSTRQIGSKAGVETTTLGVANLPPHNHTMHAETAPGTTTNPEGKMLGITQANIYAAPAPAADRTMADGSIGQAGQGQAFSNESPYLVVNVCIAITGVFPSRN